MIKLPRLPNPGNVLEARYTAKQMRDYARKAVAEATAPKPEPEPISEKCQHGIRWERQCFACDKGAA